MIEVQNLISWILYTYTNLKIIYRPHSELVEVGGGERIVGVRVCRSTPGLVATHASPHTIRVTHLHSNKVPIAAHLKVSTRITCLLMHDGLDLLSTVL